MIPALCAARTFASLTVIVPRSRWCRLQFIAPDTPAESGAPYFVHIPFTLLPTPYPAAAFDEVRSEREDVCDGGVRATTAERSERLWRSQKRGRSLMGCGGPR